MPRSVEPKGRQIGDAPVRAALVLLWCVLLLLPAVHMPGATPDVRPHPSSESAMASLESDSLRLEVVIPDRIAHGEPVPIKLRAENMSGRILELYLRGREIAFDIVVSDREGQVIWRRLEDEIIPGILRIERLEPGGCLEAEDAWPQRGSGGQMVPPGSYRVHGEWLTEGEPLITPVRKLEITPANEAPM
jgi:hypothetical protein